MKHLFQILLKKSVHKIFTVKSLFVFSIFFLAFIRIFSNAPIFKPLSTGFPKDTISKVDGEVLSNPSITRRGDTRFKILLKKVFNQREWCGYINREAHVLVKGDHSRKLMIGDSVSLDSCSFFSQNTTATGNNSKKKESKNKKKESIFFMGELISYSTPPGRIGDFKRIRKHLLLGINNQINSLPYRSGNLFRALILGEKGDLDIGLKEDIKLVGCSHLLALSGFHVSILITMVVLVFKKILGERITLFLIIPILLVYLFLAGLFPSLIRAVIMAVIGSIMVLSHRQRDKVSILMISLILQVFFFPKTVYTVSFLLSYGAIAGIFFYTPLVDRFLSGLLPVCLSRLFSVSLGAQIINTPFVFFIFGVIYPIGLIVQIIITPLITLFVWIGSLYLIISLFLPILRGGHFVLLLLGEGLEWIYILVSKLCRFFSTMSFLGIQSFAGCCIFFFVLLIPILFICVTRWRDTIAYRNFYDRL